jgi:hypothetical protein
MTPEPITPTILVAPTKERKVIHGRHLEWYWPLVHNRTILGSLFTLIHLPFMAAFLGMVIVGTFALGVINWTVLYLSLGAVGLTIYGEHLLDDTIGVGKPWNTVFSDRTLGTLAGVAFIGALVLGAYGSLYLTSPIPVIGVLVGIAFSVVYGLEIWRFHSIAFGGLGLGAVAPFSYTAQALALGNAWDPLLAGLLLLFGSTFGYVLLSLYETTKTDNYILAWKLLGMHFLTVYTLAIITIIMVAH